MSGWGIKHYIPLNDFLLKKAKSSLGCLFNDVVDATDDVDGTEVADVVDNAGDKHSLIKSSISSSSPRETYDWHDQILVQCD